MIKIFIMIKLIQEMLLLRIIKNKDIQNPKVKITVLKPLMRDCYKLNLTIIGYCRTNGKN